MALKLRQAMGLSLDDYIAENGLMTNGRPKPDATQETAGFFKRQLRSDQDQEEEDEDLLLMEDGADLPIDDGDEDEMLGDTPPPLIGIGEAGGSEPKPKTPEPAADEANEEPEPVGDYAIARPFITVEKKMGIRKLPSQQWRLNRENPPFKKPTGGQSLQSIKAEFNRNTEDLIATLGETANFNSDESRNRIQDRLGKLGRQNHNNGRNNGEQQWKQNRNRKPCVASFNPSRDRFQPQNRGPKNRGGPVNDLRPLLSASNQMAADGINPWQQQPNVPFGGHNQVQTFVDMVARLGQNPGQQPGLLGPGPQPIEVPPFTTSLLLNHISAVRQNFGPKYDMKIQKEIHNLQNKSMQYGSSGVVSTDGPGIEDERIKPVSTDLSMNMRFSSTIIEN